MRNITIEDILYLKPCCEYNSPERLEGYLGGTRATPMQILHIEDVPSEDVPSEGVPRVPFEDRMWLLLQMLHRDRAVSLCEELLRAAVEMVEEQELREELTGGLELLSKNPSDEVDSELEDKIEKVMTLSEAYDDHAFEDFCYGIAAAIEELFEYMTMSKRTQAWACMYTLFEDLGYVYTEKLTTAFVKIVEPYLKDMDIDIALERERRRNLGKTDIAQTQLTFSIEV